MKKLFQFPLTQVATGYQCALGYQVLQYTSMNTCKFPDGNYTIQDGQIACNGVAVANVVTSHDEYRRASGHNMTHNEVHDLARVFAQEVITRLNNGLGL